MALILIIDDELTFAKNAAKFLEKSNHDVLTGGTGSSGLKIYAENSPDVIVLDYRLPDMDGLEVISKIREQDAGVPIIMITGHGSIQLAVDAMKAGANDLMTKPVALGELRQRVTQLTQRQRESSRLEYYEAKERVQGDLHEIIGSSDVILDLKGRISRITAIDATEKLPPILILGETGTGKELIARACHFCSPLRDNPFIEVNCAAIPANLLESELLGHERGAFTDAKEKKVGLIEAADGGTLFLDEIGEMDPALQAKLLKVIEDGRLRRLGAVQDRHVNVRIVAATNQDLEQRIRDGKFRADLYFRLRVLQILVPPLRARHGDALVLARHFLDEFSRRYRKTGLSYEPEAEHAIAAHSWPGNVRELRNLVEQAVLLSDGARIRVSDLMLHATLPTLHDTASSVTAPAVGEGTSESSLERVEREMLKRALAESNGNVSKAARILGVSRDTLRYRLDKHGMRSA